MGSRLGLGIPKALLEVAGKPLILHHLDQLSEVEDVRIVVGYEYQKVIDLVRAHRRDVVFVFNHEFRSTHTLASLCLGARGAREMVVSLDGDLLVHPRDLRRFLACEEEVLGYTLASTDEPVFCGLEERAGEPWVVSFTRAEGKYEWTGLAKVKRSRLGLEDGFVFECLSKYLPLRGIEISCMEIDTPGDLERARDWSVRVLGEDSKKADH